MQLNPGAGELAASGPLFRIIARAAVLDAVDALIPSWEKVVFSDETVTVAAGAILVSVGGTKASTVNTVAPLVPPVVVTVTLRAPMTADGEITSVAVIWVALTTVTLLTAMSAVEAVTVAPARKFVPVKVTGTPAAWTPLDGAIAVRVGGAGLTVKTAAPLVPPAVVTVTLRAPVAAAAEIVRVAVIWVALTTVTALAVRRWKRRRGSRRPGSSCR